MSHETFKPHIAASETIKEFTLRAILLGMVFGFFFAIANVYLALKVGTTISASIPAAVMSMAIMKALFKKATILENNMVQTIGTIGEPLAGGIAFTVPALILIGDHIAPWKIFILAAAGGILGILLMIPTRRFVIVEEHGKLPFPEGTACAEILKAGEKKHHTALFALWGILIGAFYKLCSNVFFIWEEIVSWTFPSLKKSEFSIDATPALLGVGYIIGPKITSYMLAGGAFAWWVIIPLIFEFGTSTSSIYPSHIPVSAMSPDDVWDQYIRYIGAGCLGVGGIASLFQIAPLLYKTIRLSVSELFKGLIQRAHLIRTDRDISLGWLAIGSLICVLTLWLIPALHLNLFTIILLVVLSFLFSAVTSITVGLVGSTSNPVSGMTITVLLITCILFVLLGWTEKVYLIAAMTMGCVTCCAICLAGTTAQDLKTGHLLGATPIYQQLGEIIGIFIPAISLGYAIYLLNETYGIGSNLMPAPQATLLSMLTKGVITGDLPYPLVGIGILLGLIMLILRIPVLPFAIGLYLPLSLSTATMVGGLARLYVDWKKKDALTEEKGTLLASGLIGGDACLGILIAIGAIFHIIPVSKPSLLSNWVTLATFAFTACVIIFLTLKEKKGASSSSKS